MGAIGAVLVFAAPLSAQQAPARFETLQDTARVTGGGWSLVRVAKWSTLLGAGGAAVYGFMQNTEADREYEAIERMCQANPAACETKPGSSDYADPTLESRYRQVLRRDDRAQFALLAGQVGLAASVVLFILDLREESPDDIPYEPRGLRVGVHNDRLQMRIDVAVH